jgi:Ca2+/Na+ antiporter
LFFCHDGEWLRCSGDQINRSDAEFVFGFMVFTEMKAILAFCLILISIALYMYLELKTKFSQPVPYLHFAIALVGLVLLGVLLKQHFSWFRAVLLVVGVVLSGGFVWWTLSYSRYDTDPAEMKGKSAADFVLINRQFTKVPLGDMLSKSERTLVLFYRGYW